MIRKTRQDDGDDQPISKPSWTGAGDGNRTHIASLEGWHSTIELLPRRTAAGHYYIRGAWESLEPSRVKTHEGPMTPARGLRSTVMPLLGQKGPAQGHRRARALQISHESVADLRIGRQLPQVHPTDPAGRDVADQERPPGKPPAPQKRDQLIGRARGTLFWDR